MFLVFVKGRPAIEVDADDWKQEGAAMYAVVNFRKGGKVVAQFFLDALEGWRQDPAAGEARARGTAIG